MLIPAEPFLVGVFEKVLVFQEILNAVKFTFIIYTRIALLKLHFQLLTKRTFSGNNQWSQHHEFCALLKLAGARKDILRGGLFHLLSADRRVSPAYSGKEQSQVFIDFRGGSYRGTRVAGDGFLLDGNGWRQSFDGVTLWFAHTSEKLARIGTERLHITTLTFGIKCVGRPEKIFRCLKHLPQQ